MGNFFNGLFSSAKNLFSNVSKDVSQGVDFINQLPAEARAGVNSFANWLYGSERNVQKGLQGAKNSATNYQVGTVGQKTAQSLFHNPEILILGGGLILWLALRK